MRPLIGITVALKRDPSDARYAGEAKVYWNYLAAVADAGGSPILLTPLTDLDSVLPVLDGWLIPGGPDIDPKHYGEPNHPANDLIDPLRFAFDQTLMERMPESLPVLAICYGCQMLNVVRGGSLIQHLPDDPNRAEHREGTRQAYAITPGSLLHQIVGSDPIEGLSFHHQGIGRVGEGLQISARHEDGTVEAIEDPKRPFCLGVQWHPERSSSESASQRLFSAFVQAAVEYSKAKR